MPWSSNGSWPSMISTSSSDTFFEVRRFNKIEFVHVLVAAGAGGEGASTSITIVGSLELEFDDRGRGRGGACKGPERDDEVAIDGPIDFDLCECTEAGDGLRERGPGCRSAFRGNEGSPLSSSTSSALFALPTTTISSSSSIRVSLQSCLKTLSVDSPSSNGRVFGSILGSSPTTNDKAPSPRALNRSREMEAEFRIGYLTLLRHRYFIDLELYELRISLETV
jgi:hypothetical protein